MLRFQSGWLLLTSLALVPACGSDDSAAPPTTTPSVDGGADVTTAPTTDAGPDTSMQGMDSASTGSDGSDASAPGEGGGPDVKIFDGPLFDATGLEPTDPYPKAAFPPENPFTQEKATLGKILFWEEQISSKNQMACGSCHQAGAGGSDRRASEAASVGTGPNGIAGDADDVHGGRGVPRCDSTGAPKVDPIYMSRPQVTGRKPPTYLDAMFFSALFWDGRASTTFVDPISKVQLIANGGALESQAAGPPVNDVEMSCEGYTWANIATKLATATPLALAKSKPADMQAAITAHPTYPDLFAWAYGPAEITPHKIIFAIATHERTLTSNQTPWDRFNSGEKTALTAAQQRGLVLFNLKARCSQCHSPPLFTDKEFHNIGFNDPNLDKGRSLITLDTNDVGKMKTPTLRNVGLRAAGGLLHNGTNNGATLQAVITAYNQGGTNKDHIDTKMQQLDLTQAEFDDLLNFIQNGLTDPRVKDEVYPFDRPKLSTE